MVNVLVVLGELEQECIAKEEAREKETAGEINKPFPSQKKFTLKNLAETFADLNKLIKKSENIDLDPKMFSLTERSVYSALSTYKQSMKKTKTNDKANHFGHISEKSDIFSRRVSGRSFRRCSLKGPCRHRR